MNKFAITAAVLAAMPLAAPAASLDYFLKIDTIKGESSDSKHKDEIDLLSWSWGVSNSVPVSGTTGGGTASRPVFAPFSWEQGLDSSFVPLFLATANGKHLDSAVLTVRSSGGKAPSEFFKMTLSDVQMLSLQSRSFGDAIQVNAAMSYKKIEMSYRPQNANGTLGSEIRGQWDIDANKVMSFSGDPEVLFGLAQAGGNLDFAGSVPEPATWASLAAGLAVVAGIARRRRQSAAGAADSGG
jgi:type VI secretion system secreted protein Hcp